MKVLLLGFAKIAYMPYMHFYLNELIGHEVDLIYWDRDGMSDTPIPSLINLAFKFEANMEAELPLRKKLAYFKQFRQFSLNILKQNRYDKIILLHTTQGLTILDYLLLRYRKRYSLDFRDVSYERIGIYRWLVGLMARNSALTYVSSNAFRKFLPKIPIYTIHNYLKDSLNHRECHPENRSTSKIILSFWGLVRQVEVNKQLMDSIGNDPRFELHYYGRIQQDGRTMQQYATNKGLNNVFFHGNYFPEDRYTFAQSTHIIDNIYNTGATTGNAMGNKYYDGLIFRIPQICTKGSYMGAVITQQGVGLAVDFDKGGVADQIWNYYSTIDWGEFSKNCDKALEQVISEQNEAVKQLHKLLNQ